MALTSNRDVDHYVDQELRTLAVAAGARVFKGAFLGLSSGGFARPLQAGDPFAGLAYEEMDNSAGADGDRTVRVYTVGDFAHALSGAAATDVGRPVFASADDTLTFTAAGNSFVGIVQDVIAAGAIILRLDPAHRQVKSILHAVEDLSAGADIAAQAIHAFAGEAWIVSARVVNQATAAAGIDNSNPCVVTLGTGAGTVAEITFDASTPFPAENTAVDFGAVANAHVAGGDVLTLAVSNGTTADPGPFLVAIDYV